MLEVQRKVTSSPALVEILVGFILVLSLTKFVIIIILIKARS